MNGLTIRLVLQEGIRFLRSATFSIRNRHYKARLRLYIGRT